jgi:hypothetical protein
MIWTGRADEVAALGLLLDRTFAEASAAAAHPRLLDREFLIGQFELWNRHLLPAYAAAAAPLHTRRPAARAVWRCLGYAAEPGHRRWMREHLDALGLDPDQLLGEESPAALPVPDDAGRLGPVRRPLTREVADLLLADYDLADGELTGVRLELDVTDPTRLHGHLEHTAGRRYPVPEPTGLPAALMFHYPRAESFEYDLAATGPPAITSQDGLTSVAVSPVRMAGRDLTFCPADGTWHESLAGRMAVAGVPREAPPLPSLAAPPPGPLEVLASLQLSVVRTMQKMRHADGLRRWELAVAGRMFAELGAELFWIRPAALRARSALRRLQAIRETADARERGFLRRLTALEIGEGAPPPAPARVTVGSAAGLLGGLDFTDGRLRLVDITKARTVLHLDARGTIAVITLTGPRDHGPLSVKPDGLALTGAPRFGADADEVTLTVPLAGGDWRIRAAAGTCYVD